MRHIFTAGIALSLAIMPAHSLAANEPNPANWEPYTQSGVNQTQSGVNQTQSGAQSWGSVEVQQNTHDFTQKNSQDIAHYKVRHALTVLEYAKVSWQDSMWIAAKFVYDDGPRATLDPKDYEIQINMPHYAGRLYFMQNAGRNTIKDHHISNRSPYVDNQDFTLKEQTGLYPSSQNSPHIILTPKTGLQRGVPKTVLLRYTAPSKNAFSQTDDFTFPIQTRIWTKGINEKRKYKDNVKNKEITLYQSPKPIDIQNKSDIKDYYIVPYDGSTQWQEEKISLRIKSHRKFVQDDLSVFVAKTKDPNTYTFTKNDTLASYSGFALDGYAYKDINVPFTPKLSRQTLRKQSKLFIGIGSKDGEIYDRTQIPLDIRRDTEQLKTEFVSFRRQNNDNVSRQNVIDGSFQIHNVGTRDIHDYETQVYLFTSSNARCQGEAIDTYNIPKLSVNNATTKYFALSTRKDPDQYLSMAVEYKPKNNGTGKSFCHTISLDSPEWSIADTKALSIEEFRIIGELITPDPRANENTSWNIEIQNPNGKATKNHNLLMNVYLKGGQNENFQEIRNNIQVRDPNNYQIRLHNIRPLWKGNTGKERDTFTLKIQLLTKRGVLGSKNISFEATKPYFPFHLTQNVPNNLVLEQTHDISHTVEFTGDISQVENFQNLAYDTQLICGQEKTTLIERTPLPKNTIMQDGAARFEKSLQTPGQNAKANCRIQTNLYYEDSFSPLVKRFIQNGVSVGY